MDTPYPADATKQAVVSEILGKSGLLYSEPAKSKHVLCRPKILPIKSITLEKIGDSSTKDRPLSVGDVKFDLLTPALRSRAFPLELFDDVNAYETRTPEEWLQWCAEIESLGQPSADVLHSRDGRNQFVPCSVRGYDAADERFVIVIPSEAGMVKRVKRLSLRFRCEDRIRFRDRIEWAGQCRRNALLRLELNSRLRARCHELGLRMPARMQQNLADMCFRALQDLSKTSQVKCPQEILEGPLKRLVQEVDARYKMTLTKHAMGFGKSEFHSRQRTVELNREPSASLTPSVSHRCRKLSRQTRFCAPLLHALCSCWGACQQVLSLRILDTDWARRNPRSDPRKLLSSGRGFPDATKKGRQMERSATKRNPSPTPVLSFAEFIEQTRAHKEKVAEVVKRHWRDYAVRELLDKLGTTFNFLREDTQRHVESPQHAVCRMIDMMLGRMITRWLEACLEEWVRSIETPSLFPTIRIELDLSESGKVILSPSRAEIIQTFESIIDSAETALATLSTVEPELFPYCGIPSESLLTIDQELMMNFKKRVRSALLEDLREPLQLLESYAAHEKMRFEDGPPCNAAGNFEAARDFVNRCAQASAAVTRVCPGGMRSELFIVDTKNVTRKLSMARERVSRDFLISRSRQLEKEVRELRYAYRSLERQLSITPSDHEVEQLLRSFGAIEEQVLEPLQQRTSRLFDIVDFLDDSRFLISINLRADIYHLGGTCSDMRVELNLFSESLRAQKEEF
ncbi:hypothetical protein FOZ62_026198 [Perkinsus olseni]|uniref:Dynein heavy chain 1, axonemal n=1 Tax=Perkinsus olseni TaxID=32597 RepID=A0A7J6SPU3_PEROL|nr:hypothetical protein FOZ62_026198 [Perkinsus olseni]